MVYKKKLDTNRKILNYRCHKNGSQN